MTVKKLIEKLEKMPNDAVVISIIGKEKIDGDITDLNIGENKEVELEIYKQKKCTTHF